jgi:hypothetical protein
MSLKAVLALCFIGGVLAREPLFRVPIVVRGGNQIIDIHAVRRAPLPGSFNDTALFAG